MPCLFPVEVGHHKDQPLDLAPAAEMDDIAAVAAEFCFGRGNRGGAQPMVGHQPRGIERGRTVRDEGSGWDGGLVEKHGRAFSGAPVSAWRTEMVKTILTKSRLARALSPCEGRAMRDTKFPMAGGFIMAITAVVGAIVGARQGQPSAGLLLGLGAGAAISLVIWLIDRRR